MGFLDGMEKGKPVLLKNIGQGVVEALAMYIDANARMNREALHHVYEWYQTGSPEARLFNLSCEVIAGGLSVNATFRQSKTLSQDSKTPFYDKARIMENGIPVTIRPRNRGVLVFEEGGKTVFTKKEINVNQPGGAQVVGSFERTFDAFINNYFKQSFLRASGIYDYLENPFAYKTNFAQGSVGGRQVGVKAGYTWITNAKIGVEY